MNKKMLGFLASLSAAGFTMPFTSARNTADILEKQTEIENVGKNENKGKIKTTGKNENIQKNEDKLKDEIALKNENTGKSETTGKNENIQKNEDKLKDEIALKNENEKKSETAKKVELVLTKEPFGKLQQGYKLASQNEYANAIRLKAADLDAKLRNTEKIIQHLNDCAKEFKSFCDEIIKDKDTILDRESEKYSEYSTKWNELIKNDTQKLKDYNKKLEDLIQGGKEIILILESAKYFELNKENKNENAEKETAPFEMAAQNVKGLIGRMLIANKKYSEAWLKYAEEKSDFSKFDANNIEEITRYPEYKSFVKDAVKEIDDWWYNDLFVQENK